MKPPVVKSDAAFRTIGEAAEAIGVPHHVLRFWETRFPQLQPMKRGGGRRYYRPADMDLLRTIHAMLHDEGLTIRGAQKALAERGVGTASTKPKPLMPSEVETRADSGQSLDFAREERIGVLHQQRPAPIDPGRLRAIRNRLAAALAA